MKMGGSKVLLLVLFLAVCVGTWGDDVVEDAKAEKAMHDWADWAQDKFSKSFGAEVDNEKQAIQDMKYKAEDVASRATGTMKSAASGSSEYASQKATDAKEAISGAMAQGKEKTYEAFNGDAEVIKMPTDSINDARDTMGETVGQARERMGDTYDDAKQKMYTASDKASSMAHNAKDNMAESMEYGREFFYDANDKASDVYDEIRHKINDMLSDNFNEDTKQRMEMASQGIDDVKDKVKGAMGCGRDKALDAFDEAKERVNMGGDKANDAKDNIAETFDQAKHEVGETYVSAKNTMSNEAKAKYEAAKEKASDAAGDFGAKMRNNPYL